MFGAGCLRYMWTPRTALYSVAMPLGRTINEIHTGFYMIVCVHVIRGFIQVSVIGAPTCGNFNRLHLKAHGPLNESWRTFSYRRMRLYAG